MCITYSVYLYIMLLHCIDLSRHMMMEVISDFRGDFRFNREFFSNIVRICILYRYIAQPQDTVRGDERNWAKGKESSIIPSHGRLPPLRYTRYVASLT